VDASLANYACRRRRVQILRSRRYRTLSVFRQLAGPTARHINALASISKELSVAKKASKSPRKRLPPKRSRKSGSPKRTAPPPAAARPSKWTVMVYMAAEPSADLDAHAVRDLREMEEATLNSAVRVVVQINRNWPEMPQRYEITDHDAVVVVPNVPELNMGKEETLSAFLKWVVDTDPTDGKANDRGYILVLWGHSYGLGYGRDHGDGLRLDELKVALEKFRRHEKFQDHGPDGRRPLDILGANACAMAYIEAAYELRNHADYIVASQIAVPFAGWPFETVLSGIKPGISAQEIGRLIVDRYVASFRASGKGEVVAMSLLNQAALRTPDFLSKFEALALAVMDVVEATDSDASDRLSHVRAAFLSAGVGEVRPLIDLLDLCRKLIGLADDLRALDAMVPGVGGMQAAAKGIVDFVEPKDEKKPHRVQAPDRFLVVNKQTGDPRGLNGLGVFAPFVTDPADLKRLEIGNEPDPIPAVSGEPKADRRLREVKTEQRSGRTTYQALDLMKGTQWAKLVYDVLRAGLPSDVINNVEVSGATTRAERAEVTQMLVAVDSLFDVLDRRISAVRSSAVKSLPASTGASGVAPKQPDKFLELQLLRHKEVREAAQKPNGRGVSKSAPAPVQRVASNAIEGFKALETTLGDLERAVRRTLTNGTFGLGPGPGGSISLQTGSHGRKSGGGHGGPPDVDKSGGGHGAPDDKSGGGHGAVPVGVVAGVALSALADSPTAVIADLFADVGRTLQTLESAVGEAETLLAFAITSGGDVVNGGPPNAMQVDRAFRIIDDASAEARRTLRRVLADPEYGFGRGPENVTVEDRRELARAGGLSSTQLKLM
jgi:hypothetical protein